MLRIGSYNLLDFGAGDGHTAGDAAGDPAVAARERRLFDVIRGLDADVLAVQEVKSHRAELAGAQLRRLADAVGMHCAVPAATPGSAGTTAVAATPSGFNVGLLWRPGIRPVPGSRRAYGRPGDLWHGLVMVTLDVGAPVPIRFASYHADPFRPDRRFSDAIRVARTVRGHLPVVIGADWNNVSADRGPAGEHYDADPFHGNGFYPELLHQIAWSDDADAPPRVDRRSTEVLRRCGLHDAAAALNAPWQPTTGHWPGGRFPKRRIDAIRVNEWVLPALREHRVVDTDLTRSASDHLPVVVTLDPTAVRVGVGPHSMSHLHNGM